MNCETLVMEVSLHLFYSVLFADKVHFFMSVWADVIHMLENGAILGRASSTKNCSRNSAEGNHCAHCCCCSLSLPSERASEVRLSSEMSHAVAFLNERESCAFVPLGMRGIWGWKKLFPDISKKSVFRFRSFMQFVTLMGAIDRR